MKTLYIDVYFMINFTVDILAIFVAQKIVHISINIRRLILSGLIGAIFAVCELFIDSSLFHILWSSLFILIISVISCKNTSVSRKIKFLLSFYVAVFLIGGIVSFMYQLMDKYLKNILVESNKSANGKALVFSAVILLIIGALRLFIMLFSGSVNEKSVKIRIELNDKSMEIEALVDTGNLVKDPMNMNPVIFIKRSYAEKIFPSEVIELWHLDSLSTEFKKRIHLIPVTRSAQTHVMTGVRVDKVTVYSGDRAERIDATIVIDKEEGTFGGYYALTPYVAICNNV